MHTTPTYVTRRELARRFRCDEHTLENWAARGVGPRYRIIAGRALYELTDVEAFEQSRLVEPSVESAA